MKFSTTFFSLLGALSLSSSAVMADQVQAKNCQIFISSVEASPSSHGIQNFVATLQVNFLGNGETIQKVGYYGTTRTNDLGNASSCHMGLPSSDGRKRVVAFTSPTNNGSRIGEYRVSFPIYSGSIMNQCPGYSSSTDAAFFVETNQNTYWVNPAFDSSKSFVFDSNAYRILWQEVGIARTVWTSNSNLSYYNPGQCR